MIKFVDESMFDKLYKKFSIYANNKFLIALKYRDFKFYLRDLDKPFNMFFSGAIFLIASPFALIYTLLSFIPILIVKKKVK